MLNTPSLWAKVIHIDSSCWRIGAEQWKELMRRTGTALLWIRVDGFFGLANSVFYRHSQENWSRIEKLKMIMSIGDSSHLPSWETFSRPAPVLETFDVTFDIPHTVLVPDYTAISPPFSGYAPMLRRFKFPFDIIDEHVPWLNRLHSIELNGMYSVGAALGILSSTHCLQELKIGHLYLPEEISTPMPIVSLPNLKFLEYTGQPSECATFLDHIEIPLDCLVRIPQCRGLQLPYTLLRSNAILSLPHIFDMPNVI